MVGQLDFPGGVFECLTFAARVSAIYGLSGTRRCGTAFVPQPVGPAMLVVSTLAAVDSILMNRPSDAPMTGHKAARPRGRPVVGVSPFS